MNIKSYEIYIESNEKFDASKHHVDYSVEREKPRHMDISK